MTDPLPSPIEARTRDDKLRAIAHVFGDAVANRIGPTAARPSAEPPDRDRLAWQTNRLIAHLRDKVDADAKAARTDVGIPTGEATHTGAKPAPKDLARGRRLPLLIAGDDLAAEHPSVIAHLLKHESQDVRVSVLRALPGQVARAVMQRLRTG